MKKIRTTKNLTFKKVCIFGGFFHPPGYSVAAQARKPEDEKNTYMKKFGFNALVNRHLPN